MSTSTASLTHIAPDSPPAGPLICLAFLLQGPSADYTKDQLLSGPTMQPGVRVYLGLGGS